MTNTPKEEGWRDQEEEEVSTQMGQTTGLGKEMEIP